MEKDNFLVKRVTDLNGETLEACLITGCQIAVMF